VCAIGVPPKHAVDRLHQAGIPVGRPEYTNCYPDLRCSPDHEHGRAPQARPQSPRGRRGPHLRAGRRERWEHGRHPCEHRPSLSPRASTPSRATSCPSPGNPYT
jgi:hypothetical protein